MKKKKKIPLKNSNFVKLNKSVMVKGAHTPPLCCTLESTFSKNTFFYFNFFVIKRLKNG